MKKIILILGLIFILPSCINDGLDKRKACKEIRRVISSKLKAPSSAVISCEKEKFTESNYTSKTGEMKVYGICDSYEAQNSFGVFLKKTYCCKIEVMQSENFFYVDCNL